MKKYKTNLRYYLLPSFFLDWVLPAHLSGCENHDAERYRDTLYIIFYTRGGSTTRIIKGKHIWNNSVKNGKEKGRLSD